MPTYIARHGIMRFLGLFTPRTEMVFRRGDRVVLRTPRGLEIGEILCEATDSARKQLTEPSEGQILRLVSETDAFESEKIIQSKPAIIAACEKHIAALGLQMQLVEVEKIFGGERIIVYYLAEERVDFRELVKLMAAELQTRIEMRQIGVRDEAKLLADYGDCGKPVCCNTHLVAMPPVSMRMAKLQKSTLDPNKISGRCGRLKCCLRYEFDHYDELAANLPQIGSEIVTRDGKARVLNLEVLAQQLLVEMEDHRRILIDASEVLAVTKASTLPE